MKKKKRKIDIIDGVGQIFYNDGNKIDINTFAVSHFDLDELCNYARKNNMFMMYKMDYDNYYWCLFKDFRKLSDSDKYYAVMHATDFAGNNMFTEAQRKAVYFFYDTRQNGRYRFSWNSINDMEYLNDYIELYDAFYNKSGVESKSSAKVLPRKQKKSDRTRLESVVINGKEYPITYQI